MESPTPSAAERNDPARPRVTVFDVAVNHLTQTLELLRFLEQTIAEAEHYVREHASFCDDAQVTPPSSSDFLREELKAVMLADFLKRILADLEDRLPKAESLIPMWREFEAQCKAEQNTVSNAGAGRRLSEDVSHVLPAQRTTPHS